MRPRVLFVVSVLVVLSSTSALAATLKTKLVSITAGGVAGNDDSYAASISSNGRFVAFTSDASDLVPNDTLGNADVFVRDMVAGATTRASVRSNGAEGNGNSEYPSISWDGRYVAFESTASNLVKGDTNGQPDVFVHDMVTGRTKRVSVDSDEAQALNGGSYEASISADGTLVAFSSEATNLVSDDDGGERDVFVRDLGAGTTVRASVRSSGAEVGGGSSDGPSISLEGAWVVFESRASFGGTDVGSDDDVFLHNLGTGKTKRVSLLPGGVEPNGQSFAPSVSEGASVVAFLSEATDLAPPDGNGFRDVLVWVRATKAFERVSVDTAGGDASDGSTASGDPPSVSSNGRFVAFDSGADDIVSGDGNTSRDVFVRDRTTDTTVRVSLTSSGVERDGTSEIGVISADGRFVAFESGAKFTAGDSVDGFDDVFRRGPLF